MKDAFFIRTLSTETSIPTPLLIKLGIISAPLRPLVGKTWIGVHLLRVCGSPRACHPSRGRILLWINLSKASYEDNKSISQEYSKTNKSDIMIHPITLTARYSRPSRKDELGKRVWSIYETRSTLPLPGSEQETNSHPSKKI